MPQALFCRWFQPTVLNTGGKASSSVEFIPFHNIPPEKGLKPTEESGKAGKFNYPSVETDGKREPAARGEPRLRDNYGNNFILYSGYILIQQFFSLRFRQVATGGVIFHLFFVDRADHKVL